MSDKPLNPNGKSYGLAWHGDEFRLLEIFDETKGGVSEHQKSKAFNEVGSRTDVVASHSITQYSWRDNGLAAQLADVYSRKLDVVNHGLAGYTTRWAKPYIEQWLLKAEKTTQIATIWLGANDCSKPGWAHHVPLDEFVVNLREIVSLIQSPTSPTYSPLTSLILITPPPIHPPSWLKARVKELIAKEYPSKHWDNLPLLCPDWMELVAAAKATGAEGPELH
ncbi:hypothetical protein JCM8097_001584 [Rhodosporidiobolus ruineniae]